MPPLTPERAREIGRQSGKNLTKSQRRIRASKAALTRWSQEDPAANAARGQAGLQRKFYNQTDPTLPEAERQRRAYAAFRAHMAGLAFQRSKRASRTPDAGEAA
jgi:hypothetical protein